MFGLFKPKDKPVPPPAKPSFVRKYRVRDASDGAMAPLRSGLSKAQAEKIARQSLTGYDRRHPLGLIAEAYWERGK